MNRRRPKPRPKPRPEDDAGYFPTLAFRDAGARLDEMERLVQLGRSVPGHLRCPFRSVEATSSARGIDTTRCACYPI